jgi:hypothetical protein
MDLLWTLHPQQALSCVETKPKKKLRPIMCLVDQFSSEEIEDKEKYDVEYAAVTKICFQRKVLLIVAQVCHHRAKTMKYINKCVLKKIMNQLHLPKYEPAEVLLVVYIDA